VKPKTFKIFSNKRNWSFEQEKKEGCSYRRFCIPRECDRRTMEIGRTDDGRICRSNGRYIAEQCLSKTHVFTYLSVETLFYHVIFMKNNIQWRDSFQLFSTRASTSIHLALHVNKHPDGGPHVIRIISVATSQPINSWTHVQRPAMPHIDQSMHTLKPRRCCGGVHVSTLPCSDCSSSSPQEI